MAYVILQVPGDGEVIGLGFLTRIRDNQEFFHNRPGLGDQFQRFTSSGTWTKPAEITWVFLRVVGGGAGGWGRVSTPRLGGSGGNIAHFLIRASSVGSSVSVTVGTGGEGSRIGLSTPTNGGSSSFGSYGAAGGVIAGQGTFINSNFTVMRAAGRPGQGGHSSTDPTQAQGLPGLGATAFTPLGTDGADSSNGTGSGGGGREAGFPGDGGVPGGGGGSTSGGTRDGGDGGRGEVVVSAW